MQTRVEKKDLELENVVGNLLIAEYQVERLRERVSQNLGLDSTNLGKISESVFSIGNGRMGQRANFEEEYSGETLQ